MFCHNKPLFRARSEGLGRLAHSVYYLKEIENIFFVFLSSYRNTREGLRELEKAVETLACGSCSHSISRSPKPPLVFL